MSGGHPFSADRSEAKTVACMTSYEIIMILLGVIGLLISFGGLLIALLNFLDKRSKKRK